MNLQPRSIHSRTSRTQGKREKCCGAKSIFLTRTPNELIFFDMKKTHASGIPAEWLYLSRLFSALGDEERQRILLLFPAGGKLNASQITQASTLSRPTVSHHLKVLCKAGVLDRSKQGREIHFGLRTAALIDHLQSVIDYLEAHR